ncbi:small-subunit processome [Halteromyces radiatus]|uniref:small-subunit processome n=1 Tax=Halteromyces radiatus TaxID=101107 RepID=UPI00221FF4A4|nr:small-subunit processome [Halteromyces radiatus]KAI8092752.1 small-subunit processome [Halteromyces radiatus]
MVRPQQKKGNYKNNKKGNRRKQDITDVFEADDDERQLQRKGHDLDEVDNYEYQVGDIQGDDDEEIDSDEAFDESDDDRFDHFKFAGSTKVKEKKKKRKAKKNINSDDETGEINLDESDQHDSDNESDVNGDDYMDIADMLSDNEAPGVALDNETANTLLPANNDEDSDMEEFLGFSDDDEDTSNEDDSYRDQQEVTDFITSLDTKKRKLGMDKDGKKRQKQLTERSEVYKENEFNLPAQKPTSAGKKTKLDLKDLMGSMDGEVALSELRETVKSMAADSKKQTALDAPLPQRIQDRIERQAAYKEANKEITRWEPTVKQNREADHLSFPMQESVTQQKLTSSTLASKFVANTDMEKQIEQALQQAGMKDEELEEFEALKLNKLTVEEVEERRKQLAMMRELMFRHEVKAKRMKKIKSKSYRKLKRQEKARLEDQMAKLQELDHEISLEEQQEAAMSRAEERMSLKHKNTGKWARRALARGQQDEGTRDAIMEQLQRGEQLRRKIQGQESGDDESGDDSDHDDDGVERSEKERIAMELDALEKDLDQDTPGKGIFAMKFMQDAAKREQLAAKEELDEFRNEWLDENSDNDEKNAQDPTYSHVANNPGRMAFATSVPSSSPLADLDSTDANPWLQNDTSRISKKASKSNKAVKGKKIQPKEDEEEDVELDLTNVLSTKQPSSGKSSKTKSTATTQATVSESTKNISTSQQPSTTLENNEDSDDDEDDVAAPTMISTSNKLSFNQRELVARAFANDNVVEEFEQEKEDVIAEDGDKVEDLTLPGWGSWGGKGIKTKAKNKKKIIKVTKGIDAAERKDSKLANVIINEKRHKKSEKYQATTVPFPFKSMEQYEHSLRAPVGKEWNTRDSYQKMTKPRVMTKLGTVIDPLSVPFK